MRVTDKVRVASVLDLSYYKDKQFDLVVSIELLEHIPEAHTGQALRELARVSKRAPSRV
jgi:ubiquinone/menaquinone biosynthesis C-methylase UbiE